MLTSVATVAPDLIRSNAYVDGRWVDADSGETFPVVNPATGETLADVPRLGATETRRAIEAAERALPAWKARTAKERARILTRLATLMAAREDDLATLMVLEQGKPLAEARAEIAYALSFYEWFAEQAKRVDGAVIPSPSPDRPVRSPPAAIACSSATILSPYECSTPAPGNTCATSMRPPAFAGRKP